MKFKKELMLLDDDNFESYYNKVLRIVEKNTKEINEKKILGKILYNEDLDLRDISIV